MLLRARQLEDLRRFFLVTHPTQRSIDHRAIFHAQLAIANVALHPGVGVQFK